MPINLDIRSSAVETCQCAVCKAVAEDLGRGARSDHSHGRPPRLRLDGGPRRCPPQQGPARGPSIRGLLQADVSKHGRWSADSGVLSHIAFDGGAEGRVQGRVRCTLR